MPDLPPGTGPMHTFRLDSAKSIKEAEQIAGFKANRQTRGTFRGAFVGLVFGFPAIAVTHRTGPKPTDFGEQFAHSSLVFFARCRHPRSVAVRLARTG